MLKTDDMGPHCASAGRRQILAPLSNDTNFASMGSMSWEAQLLKKNVKRKNRDGSEMEIKGSDESLNGYVSIEDDSTIARWGCWDNR